MYDWEPPGPVGPFLDRPFLISDYASAEGTSGPPWLEHMPRSDPSRQEWYEAVRKFRGSCTALRGINLSVCQ